MVPNHQPARQFGAVYHKVGEHNWVSCVVYGFINQSFSLWPDLEYLECGKPKFINHKPTIYKAYFSDLCKGISPENIALQFRILEFPLIWGVEKSADSKPIMTPKISRKGVITGSPQVRFGGKLAKGKWPIYLPFLVAIIDLYIVAWSNPFTRGIPPSHNPKKWRDDGYRWG